MIRATTRAALALTAASLLLTACAGGDGTAADPKPASAAPTEHPVFAQKLDRQVFLATRRTQKAGNARFVQTLTFGSKKTGALVRTMTGRMDFAGERGQAEVVWKIPGGTSEATRATLLGDTPGLRVGPATVGYLIEEGSTYYRSAASGYWIRYASGAQTESDALDHLRGTEAPVGDTLLEGLSGAEATAQSPASGGERTYRATMPYDILSSLFPYDLRNELDTFGSTGHAQAGVPLTVTADREGRITRATADLSTILKKDGVFAGYTTLTSELTLAGYGTSAPDTTPSGTVRAAEGNVLDMRDVKNGGCVDFDSGQRSVQMVVTTDCAKPHDARVFTQIPLRAGTSNEDSQARGKTACSVAHDMARPAWMPKKVELWAWWTPVPPKGTGKDKVTCYLTTKRGDS